VHENATRLRMNLGMFFHALVLAASTGPCDGATTQMDLNVCWAAQAKAAQQRLDEAYRKVTAELQVRRLDAGPVASAQTAWLAARESTCAFEAAIYAGGSIAPMAESMCETRTAQNRTTHLKSYLDYLRAQSAPPKALPVASDADAELNRVYGLLARQLTSAQRSQLLRSEDAWLAYRDKTCAIEGGSCLTDLERERTAELEAGWLGEKFW